MCFTLVMCAPGPVGAAQVQLGRRALRDAEKGCGAKERDEIGQLRESLEGSAAKL